MSPFLQRKSCRNETNICPTGSLQEHWVLTYAGSCKNQGFLPVPRSLQQLTTSLPQLPLQMLWWNPLVSSGSEGAWATHLFTFLCSKLTFQFVWPHMNLHLVTQSAFAHLLSNTHTAILQTTLNPTVPCVCPALRTSSVDRQLVQSRGLCP